MDPGFGVGMGERGRRSEGRGDGLGSDDFDPRATGWREMRLVWLRSRWVLADEVVAFALPRVAFACCHRGRVMSERTRTSTALVEERRALGANRAQMRATATRR